MKLKQTNSPLAPTAFLFGFDFNSKISASNNTFSNNSGIPSLENEVVKVQLEGACIGCSVNQMTLKNGVEATIKKYAPHIQQVINID